MGYRRDTNAWMAFETHLGPLIHPGDLLLEVGPGNVNRSLVHAFCREKDVRYHFADLRNGARHHPGFVDMVCPDKMASVDCRFDWVVAFQMCHNVARIWTLFPELARVLVSGGRLGVVATVTQTINRHPVDYGRIFPDGMQVLMEDAGLAVEKNELVTLDGRQLATKHEMRGQSPVDLVAIGRKP